jgi:hypothetical protein
MTMLVERAWTEGLRWVYALSMRWPDVLTDVPLIALAATVLLAVLRLWGAADGQASRTSTPGRESA